MNPEEGMNDLKLQHVRSMLHQISKSFSHLLICRFGHWGKGNIVDDIHSRSMDEGDMLYITIRVGMFYIILQTLESAETVLLHCDVV